MMEVNRRFSFKGRKLWARCEWKDNEMIFNLNIWMKESKKGDFKIDEFWWTYCLVRTDFHEWLHIFIHRESGVKGTYWVTDACEKFIVLAEQHLGHGLEIVFPDHRTDYGWFAEFNIKNDKWGWMGKD